MSVLHYLWIYQCLSSRRRSASLPTWAVLLGEPQACPPRGPHSPPCVLERDLYDWKIPLGSWGWLQPLFVLVRRRRGAQSPDSSFTSCAHPSTPFSAPRDHFLTRPGPHLFPGWPRATIRDLPILLLLHRILPTRFAYPRNLRLYPLLSSVRHLPLYRGLSSLRL